MEFYKLLLYEKGSHFLPHQDTQKANGMFATVIILLPSKYTGGQVVVSHASKTKTVDFAPDSLYSSALLAWYTDVKHEVKPVKSGYRLALSYNLIHTAPPEVPQPCIPDMSESVYALRRVLRKWIDGRYQNMPEPPLVAYLLDHQYSTANLQHGHKALKGADAHRVSFLRDIAEDLGFIVGLASLTHNVTGAADDDGADYYRRRARCYSDSEDEGFGGGRRVPSMEEEGYARSSVSGLVDLNGSLLLPGGQAKITLSDDALIPRDAFEDVKPDRTEYEGYMGNGAGQLDYWYHRTALVLMLAREVDDICFSVAGLSYAFSKLEKSTTKPTQEDKLWAGRILEKGSSLNKEQATAMFDYALKWKDADMWKTVMKCPVCTLEALDESRLKQAWKVFSFKVISLSFEEFLARSKGFHNRVNFVYNLEAHAPRKEAAAVSKWCKKELDKVLRCFTAGDPKDVPLIMKIIDVSGLDTFLNVVMPTAKQSSYAFWLAMIKALRNEKKEISEKNPVAIDVMQDTIWRDCRRQSHQRLPSSCPPPVASGVVQGRNLWVLPARSTGSSTQTDRVIELLEIALLNGDLDSCTQLFVNVLCYRGSSVDNFRQIYNYLIPRLKSFLESRNIDICTPPFVDVFQVLVGRYLRDILGTKTPLVGGNIRHLRCGCATCTPLHQFLSNPSSRVTDIKMTKTRQHHLESQIAAASDLFTAVRIQMGKFPGMRVTKRPAVVETGLWLARQQAARRFLSTVGPDQLVQKIMGTRYPDVVVAINGTKGFDSVRSTLSKPSVSAWAALVAQAAAFIPPQDESLTEDEMDSVSELAQPGRSKPVYARTKQTAVKHTDVDAVRSSAPGQLAGQKRKSGPVNLGPVIYLTEETTD
ncbi:hypothetical protein NLJ89_g3859 [Agrocybe chaxingu]|uniref:Prolyl 4-hydroxylase alpha subunit Fe(2+) 2OG dioxygenase domain-containing protein n=1 Tax=Agrocybe chaxingu TaxID=84603 RepID=A0A9W8K3Y6_9AGAR|nr:hypothetical protein NLJ89_g3859 [Agrocybe chaxingu]